MPLSVDPADVRPSVLNWVVVGLMAVTFIVFGKYLLSRYPIPGLSAIFNAA